MERIARVVVQARMCSARLPGKILEPLAGRPMLAHVVGRLQAAFAGNVDLQADAAAEPLTWQVTVATSDRESDDATQACCDRLGVRCFRGSESDVLARYVEATRDLSQDDLVIRATADNPLYCPRRTRGIVSEHLQSNVDYTSIENLSYVVPEVMRCQALRSMAQIATSAHDREHVTPYFRRPGHAFAVRQLSPRWRGLRPEVRFTVDTPQELECMRELFQQFATDGPLFTLEDAYEARGTIGTISTTGTPRAGAGMSVRAAPARLMARIQP